LLAPVNNTLEEISNASYGTGMTTPAQIRAARALLGWTQAELAAKAGISATSLNNLERGAVDPKLSTVNAIRRALEDTGIEFLPGEGLRLKTGTPAAAGS
jgi:transcriptional regulator with XRE-family HTH domain